MSFLSRFFGPKESLANLQAKLEQVIKGDYLLKVKEVRRFGNLDGYQKWLEEQIAKSGK